MISCLIVFTLHHVNDLLDHFREVLQSLSSITELTRVNVHTLVWKSFGILRVLGRQTYGIWTRPRSCN